MIHNNIRRITLSLSNFPAEANGPLHVYYIQLPSHVFNAAWSSKDSVVGSGRPQRAAGEYIIMAESKLLNFTLYMILQESQVLYQQCINLHCNVEHWGSEEQFTTIVKEEQILSP